MNNKNNYHISGETESPDNTIKFLNLSHENYQKNKKHEENKIEKQKKGFGKNIKNTYYDFNNKYIKIGTHNVQGFNKESKQYEFMDEYKDNDLDIIGFTETKLSLKNSKYVQNNNQYYKSWWTGIENNNHTGGVGIAVKMGLHLHVANVISRKGRLISLDLNFKGTDRIRIINIYINCNEREKSERESLIDDLKDLLIEGKKNNYRIIIMGDFNADAEKYDKKGNIKNKGKYRIIQLLRNENLYDTHKMTNLNDEIDFTWNNSRDTKRRLDYIWITENLIQDLIITRIEHNELLTEQTDHKLITMVLDNTRIFGKRSKAKEKRNKAKRKIYKINEMNEENWKYFREIMKEELDKNNFVNEFNIRSKDQRWFNRVWNKINGILKDTMNKTIPTKEIYKSDYSKKPKLSTETFKANKWLMRIWRTIKKNQILTLDDKKFKKFFLNMESVINKYQININMENVKINFENNNKENILDDLKKIKKILNAKIKVEDKLFVMDQITKSIDKRIENMEDNKKRMLDSILEREKRSINIDRLIIKKDNKSELILEKEEILSETNKHFRGITDSLVEHNEELENYWKDEYAPRVDIDNSIYETLLEDIEEEEWLDSIRNLSKGKAGGLSKITYEIIKESNGEMKEILRKFYNECIRAELMLID